MLNKSKTIFENQYTNKDLKYKETYSWLRKLLIKYLNDRYSVTVNILKNIKGKNILDFGCGSGDILFKLTGQFDEYYGLDIIKSRIDEANSNVQANLVSEKDKYHFSVNNSDEAITYPNEHFDVIASIAVLPWIYDIYFITNEFNRLLAKKGYLVVECSNFAYFKRRIKLLFGKLPTTSPTNIEQWPKIGWDAGCLHSFTKKEMIILLKQSKFNILQAKPTGFIINIFKLWPNLFATGWVILAQKE